MVVADVSSGRQILPGLNNAGWVLMGAKYTSATGRAERVSREMYVPLPIPLILNSQLTHFIIDAPGTKTEPPAARAPRAVTAQLHVHGRALAVVRQRVNSMLVPERGTRWCTLLIWRWLGCCASPTHDHNFSFL